jgi:hypothetical protein
MDWGEVTYEGNQVYLRDVPANKIIFRVTLDEQGRAAASYYNYQVQGGYLKDTTYYFYTGNRLDSLIHFYETYLYAPNAHYSWAKHKFIYDSYGNTTAMVNPQFGTVFFKYDYTKPVTGMTSEFHLLNSLKLMEYMDLLKLPMHHALTRITYGHYDGAGIFRPAFDKEYHDYVIADGYVQSYVSGDRFKETFYNGWDCGGLTSAINPNGRQKQGISSVEEFKKLYPF